MVRDRIQARIDRLQKTGIASSFVRRRLDPDSPSGLVATVGFMVFAAGLFGFGILAAHAIAPDAVGAADEAVNRVVSTLRSRVLTSFFSAMTFSGNTLSMTVLVLGVVIVAVRARRRAAAVYIAATVAGGSLLVSLVKWLVDRPRPPLDLASFPPPDSASFPSGHTMASFLFAATLIVGLLPAVRSPRARVVLSIALTAWAIAVAVSRVYLGVHWLSDVFASWFLGVSWFALTTALFVASLDRVRARARARGRAPAAP